MKILIQELLRHSRNIEHKEDIKKFQLLIYKLFSTIEVLNLALDTQNNILQSLEMISDLVQNDRIMENSEIRYMFYTDHSTSAILSLISKKYSLIGEGRKVRQFAYGILIRLMEIDTAAARKSFRTWTHIEDNKNMFFSRIQRLIIQFNTFFVEEK